MGLIFYYDSIIIINKGQSSLCLLKIKDKKIKRLNKSLVFNGDILL